MSLSEAEVNAVALITVLGESGRSPKGVAQALLEAVAVLHHQARRELRATIEQEIRKLLLAVYQDPACSRCQTLGDDSAQESYVQQKSTGR